MEETLDANNGERLEMPRLERECATFRAKIWRMKLQLEGKELLPESGVIRTAWLDVHRKECADCRGWQSRIMAPYWEYLLDRLSETLAVFAKTERLSIKDIVIMMRLRFDHGRVYKNLRYAKQLEKTLKTFTRYAQLPRADFRKMLVDWLGRVDPQ